MWQLIRQCLQFIANAFLSKTFGNWKILDFVLERSAFTLRGPLTFGDRQMCILVEWLPHSENQTFIRKNQSLYIRIAIDERFYIKWYEKTVDFLPCGA